LPQPHKIMPTIPKQTVNERSFFMKAESQK